MAQENNTAREQTALEKLSQDALNQARRERKMIQDTCIAELAQCDTEIPEALEKQVQAEIASLQQAKENLSSAHKIASSTVDELSARAADVAKSLNRKWYRINPPSNTAIDVQEEEKSFFARGMNGYKIALIVFIGSFAGVLGARLGLPILDPIASIVICLFIFKVAFDLVRTGLNELLERSLPADVEEEILRIVTADPEVCQPHNLRTRRIGAAIAVEVHVRMDGAMTVARSHALTVDIERRLRARFGEGTMIAIHVEPLKAACRAE